MPKISVIIPVYNVEQYLRQCLDSVINQTLKDIEIICVNDGSMDNSLHILEEYAQKDNRIRIINQENKGRGIARNYAISIANGDYIMFLDSDDWLELDACEYAYTWIKKNDNDFVFFGTYIYDEKTNLSYIDSERLYAYRGNFYNSHIKLKELEKPYMGYCECWNKIYNKQFLLNNKIKFNDNKLKYEDQPFYFKSLLHANTVSILDKPLYNYRIRQFSATQSPNGWNDLIKTRNQILEELLEFELADKKFIDFYIISCTYSILGYYNRFAKKNKLYKKNMYIKMREFFTSLDKRFNLENYREFINYKLIRKIIKYDYEYFQFKNFITSIIGLYNENGKYKVLKLFGIGIVLKQY